MRIPLDVEKLLSFECLDTNGLGDAHACSLECPGRKLALRDCYAMPTPWIPTCVV